MALQIPKKYKDTLQDILETENSLEKIFFITVGPNVKTYNDLLNISDTKKWYLYSQLDKFISRQLDSRVMYNYFNQLKNIYKFPDSLLTHFSGYNYQNTYGYRANFYNLDKTKLKPEILQIIENNIEARQLLLKRISEKGIDINNLNKNITTESIKTMLKNLETQLTQEQRFRIENLIKEKGGDIKNVHPKDILLQFLNRN